MPNMDLNSQPQDGKLHALPTRPAKHLKAMKNITERNFNDLDK